MTPEHISSRELAGRIRAGTPLVLLDVREPFEREVARIPVGFGSTDLFIPMREIPGRLDEIRSAVSDTHPELVVYCHHGVRSMMVANWLCAQGVPRVVNLDGGIDAYSLEADPDVPRYV